MRRRCCTSRWFLSVGVLCGALGMVPSAAGQAPPRRSLSELLAEIQELHRRNLCGPKITLDPDLVAKLDVARGKSTWETIGLLRHGFPLAWPETLRDGTFQHERKRIDRLLPEAARQARTGGMAAKLIKELEEAAKNLSRRLDEQIDNLTPPQYIESKRFSRQIDGTIAVLQREDVRDYFQAVEDLPAQCRTVQDLVVYAAEHGFGFVGPPPWDGDYKNLMQALETYAEKARPRPAEKK